MNKFENRYSFFLASAPFPFSPPTLDPKARVMASASPPMHNAQKMFSKGANGSWIPRRIEEILKYTKNTTIPKYRRLCGAEITSVFLSRINSTDAAMHAFVGLNFKITGVLNTMGFSIGVL